MADQDEQNAPSEALPAQPAPSNPVAEFQHAQLSQYSGPLPAPEDFIRYNEGTPDAADRILRMAEDALRSQLEINKIVVESNVKRANQGLAAGLVVAPAGFLTSYGFARMGHPIEGATIAGADLLGLVSVFVIGRTSQRAEREEKARNAAGRKKQ